MFSANHPPFRPTTYLVEEGWVNYALIHSCQLYGGSNPLWLLTIDAWLVGMAILLFALLYTYWEDVGEIMHPPTGKSQKKVADALG